MHFGARCRRHPPCFGSACFAVSRFRDYSRGAGVLFVTAVSPRFEQPCVANGGGCRGYIVSYPVSGDRDRCIRAEAPPLAWDRVGSRGLPTPLAHKNCNLSTHWHPITRLRYRRQKQAGSTGSPSIDLHTRQVGQMDVGRRPEHRRPNSPFPPSQKGKSPNQGIVTIAFGSFSVTFQSDCSPRRIRQLSD